MASYAVNIVVDVLFSRYETVLSFFNVLFSCKKVLDPALRILYKILPGISSSDRER